MVPPRDMTRAVLLAGALLLLAAVVHGGIYQVAVSASGAAYTVNRFTGSVVLCTGSKCWAPRRDE